MRAGSPLARSGCAKEPTFSDQIGAAQYVQATSQAVGRYATPAVAQAAGYEAVSPTDYPVVYYVNPTIVTANRVRRTHVRSRCRRRPRLCHDTFGGTGSGRSHVLASRRPHSKVRQCPTVRSSSGTNAPACVFPRPASPTDPLPISGFAPCTAGSTTGPTPYLTMVWQVPVAGGPFGDPTARCSDCRGFSHGQLWVLSGPESASGSKVGTRNSAT